MSPSTVHSFIEEQNALRTQLNVKNISIEDIDTIMGMDCAYWETNEISFGCVAYQIFSYKTGEILEEDTEFSTIQFPYIPGLLYYHEKSLMEIALESTTIKPSIIVCDGNGILHPRKMGEASQFGIVNNIPTFGIAKNLYKFENLEKIDDYFYLNGEVLAKEVYLSKHSKKACFISSGYKISLEDAIEVTKHMQNFSQKETKYSYITKGSDHLVREFQKDFISKFGGEKQ